MNAATKKTGKNQRAAFAIEEAIADTRSRIAASAGADLKQKAQAALEKPKDAYKFGGATARNLLRFACDGIKPPKGYEGMVNDVHALLKGEAGERGRDGLCDGLVYLTQADYSDDLKPKAKASGPRLQTERDGRIFAVDVLERLKNADADKATAYPYTPAENYGSDEITPWRKGPQWDGFYRDLSHLLTGTEEARKGFASIFTDCLVEDIGFDLDVYRKLEAAGLFQDFGTPGTKYQAPKRTEAERTAIVEKNAEATAKARGPQVAPSEAAKIEAFLTDENQWALRHDAIVFLSHGFDEMLKSIRRNKKDAEYYAEVSAALKASQESYMIIYMRLSEAARDMAQAVAQRKDGAQILRKMAQKVAKARSKAKAK